MGCPGCGKSTRLGVESFFGWWVVFWFCFQLYLVNPKWLSLRWYKSESSVCVTSWDGEGPSCSINAGCDRQPPGTGDELRVLRPERANRQSSFSALCLKNNLLPSEDVMRGDAGQASTGCGTQLAVPRAVRTRFSLARRDVCQVSKTPGISPWCREAPVLLQVPVSRGS